MFQYDENKFFNDGFIACPHKPEEKPHYSLPEHVEETSRKLNESLERLIRFEERMTQKYDDLMHNMTHDNVTFKELARQAYSDFVSTVRSEINLFETDTSAIVEVFKQSVNKTLEDFNANHNAAFEQYQFDLGNQISAFETEMTNEINAAVAYMKTNINQNVTSLLNTMKDDGSLVGVIDSNLIACVKQFGAVGDGVTDDTDAIEAALATGKAVYIPNGTYMVKRLDIPSGAHLYGNGVNTVIKLINNAVEYQYPIYINNVSNVLVENLVVDANNDNQTADVTLYGICIYKSHNITIRNCEIKYATADGLKIGHPDMMCSNVVVENCYIHGNARNEVSLLYCANVTFRDCRISGNNTSAVVDLELHASGNSIKNVTFDNCEIIATGEGVKILSNEWTTTYEKIVFTNCRIQAKIYIKKFDGVTIEKCQCAKGVELIGCKDIVLRLLRIYGGTNGVYAYDLCNNLKVIDCDVVGTNGVLVQNSDNVAINGCHIHGCTVGIGIYNAVNYSVLSFNKIINNTTGIKFVAETYFKNYINGCYLANTTNIEGMVSGRTTIDDFSK